jgi:hypothetical protein
MRIVLYFLYLDQRVLAIERQGPGLQLQQEIGNGG